MEEEDNENEGDEITVCIGVVEEIICSLVVLNPLVFVSI